MNKRRVVPYLIFIQIFFISNLFGLNEIKDQADVSAFVRLLRAAAIDENQETFDCLMEEISIKGSPILETIKDDETHHLVTFIWNGDEFTDEVGLFFEYQQSNQNNYWLLERIEETVVWFKTFCVPSDLRTVYSFLIKRDGHLELKLDPMNCRTMWYPDHFQENISETGKIESILEMPYAPSEEILKTREDIEKGVILSFDSVSANLSNERKIWVYTPPGYSNEKGPYHLLVLFDGEAYIRIIPTVVILDNLIADRLIHPLVVVFVSSISSKKREIELPCFLPFSHYIAEELMPWLRKTFNITSNPSSAAIGGVSFGGLAAFYVGLNHPEIFGNILSQSGAFWYRYGFNINYEEQGYIAEKLFKIENPQHKIYLDIGLIEKGPWVGTNRLISSILSHKGYTFRYREFNGRHDYINWRGTLAEGLIFLFQEQRL